MPQYLEQVYGVGGATPDPATGNVPSASLVNAALGGGAINAIAYGVVADGKNGRFYATYASGGNLLSIFTLNAATTVQNINGQAVVTYVTNQSIHSPQATDIGSNCHVPGAGTKGGDFVSPIVAITPGGTNSNGTTSITLRDPAPTIFTNVATNLTWPCFASPSWSAGNPNWTKDDGSDHHKAFRIGEGQTPKGLNIFAGTVNKYQCPVFGTIDAILSPASVLLRFPMSGDVNKDYGFTWSVASGFGFSVTANPGMELDWGTDNTMAILRAATAAALSGVTDIYFSGAPDKIVFCLGYCTPANGTPWTFEEFTNGVPGTLNSGTTLTAAQSAAFYYLTNNIRLLSDGVTARFFSIGGALLPYQICPRTFKGAPAPRKSIKGTKNFPRLASLTAGTTANVVVWSASIYATSPSGGGQSLMADAINTFMRALRAANGGRLKFNKVDRAIGGQWMTNLDQQPSSFPTSTWYTDVSKQWFFYINPIPSQNGTPAAPDLVLLFEDGSNPKFSEHGPAVLSLIRKIGTIAALNGHTPDILMVNCRPASYRWNVNNAGGNTVNYNGAGPASTFIGNETASTFLETFAESLGVGFLDIFHPAMIAHDGWSPRVLAERSVAAPLASTTVAPLTPLDLRYAGIRDYSVWITIIAASGAAAFASVGMMKFSLSKRFGNEMIVGMDNATGNVAVMATSFGRWMNDTVSLNTGTGVLTCNAVGQRTATGVSYTGALGNLQINSGLSLTAADTGSAIQISTAGWQATPFISAISDASIPILTQLADPTTYNTGGNQSGTMIVGGGQFIQKDADAQLDIVIFQGTNVFTGKITGFTSTGVVTTTITGTTLTNAAVTMFVGHLSQPWTVTAQPMAATGANPTIVMSKAYNKVEIGYLLNANGNTFPVWSGNVTIWGGDYTPKVFITAAGPANLVPSNMRIDRKILFTPSMTDLEFWGDGSGTYDDGGGVVHPTSRHLTLVDEVTCSAQDFSVV